MSTGKTFHLNLVKVDGPVFTGEVNFVTVPGSEGDMTILANHTPLVSALRKGEIVVSEVDGKESRYEVSSGTIEFSHNVLNILI